MQATDLVLSGPDVSSISPIRATSINVVLNPDAIKSTTGVPIVSYSDSVVIDWVSLPPSSTTTSTPLPSPSPLPLPITPPPAQAPTAHQKKGKHNGSHPHQPVVTTVNHAKKKAALEGTNRTPAFHGRGKKG